MLRSCWRALRTRRGTLCFVGAALLLCACTSTTARLAGWYVTRQIDGYLELTREQHQRARARVDELLDVLRREELPRWLHLLRQTRDAMGRGPDEAELTALQQRYDALLDAGAARVVPGAALILAELDDAQIAHFRERLIEQHEKTYEDLKLPASEQRAKLDERLIEGVEDIVGELREEQGRMILARVHALPDERPMRDRIDRARIGEFAKFLRGHPGAAAIERELLRLWDTRYAVLGPDREKIPRRAEQRQLLLAIDGSLSPEQREHAVEAMNERIRDAKRFLLPPQP